MLEGHTDPHARLPRPTARAAEENLNPNQPLKISQGVLRTVPGTRASFVHEGPFRQSSSRLHHAQGSFQEQTVDRARGPAGQVNKFALQLQ